MIKDAFRILDGADRAKSNLKSGGTNVHMLASDDMHDYEVLLHLMFS